MTTTQTKPLPKLHRDGLAYAIMKRMSSDNKNPTTADWLARKIPHETKRDIQRRIGYLIQVGYVVRVGDGEFIKSPNAP